jgi:hypothetical protein
MKFFGNIGPTLTHAGVVYKAVSPGVYDLDEAVGKALRPLGLFPSEKALHDACMKAATLEDRLAECEAKLAAMADQLSNLKRK